MDEGPVDSKLVPNGVGTKIEIEAPTQINASQKTRLDFAAIGLKPDKFDGEGIFTGFDNGKAVTINMNGFLAEGSYTIQVVMSSSIGSSGYFVGLRRDSGKVLLGEAKAPSTGGLDKYQIVTIPNVTFTADKQDIAVGIERPGTGTINIESFYVIADNDPALSISEFDAALANQIKLYPNPVVNDVLTIESPEDFEYSIFDLEGKTIVSKVSYDKAVVMSAFSPGIYFVQLYINGKSQVYKIIKE